MPPRKEVPAVPAAQFSDEPAEMLERAKARALTPEKQTELRRRRASRAGKVTTTTLQDRVAQWLPNTDKIRRQGEQVTDWGKDSDGRTIALRTSSGVYPFPLS